MKTAFVLSGGGAKGAFQAGVMSQLSAQGVTPDVIYGTSVGALNAAAYAYNDAATVVSHWMTITGKSDILGFNWLTLLLCSDGIYNMNPLSSNYVTKAVTGTPKCEAIVCCTNLDTGGTEYFSNLQTDITTFQRRAMGSGAIPGIMSPVDNYVDGGVRMQVPIQQAIDDGADVIYIVSCNPWQNNPQPYSTESLSKFIKFLNIAYHAVNDIMEHEVFYSNIQAALYGSFMAQKAGTSKPVQFYLYAPTAYLYDTLTFDPTLIQGAIYQGQAAQPLDLNSFLLPR